MMFIVRRDSVTMNRFIVACKGVTRDGGEMAERNRTNLGRGSDVVLQ